MIIIIFGGIVALVLAVLGFFLWRANPGSLPR